jgi:hypothetical protein
MFTHAYISIAKSYAKEGNRKLATEYFEKAKGELSGNTFYNGEQKQELITEIEAVLKVLRN